MSERGFKPILDTNGDQVWPGNWYEVTHKLQDNQLQSVFVKKIVMSESGKRIDHAVVANDQNFTYTLSAVHVKTWRRLIGEEEQLSIERGRASAGSNVSAVSNMTAEPAAVTSTLLPVGVELDE